MPFLPRIVATPLVPLVALSLAAGCRRGVPGGEEDLPGGTPERLEPADTAPDTAPPDTAEDTAPPGPFGVAIDARTTTLVADGRDETILDLYVTAPDGTPAPDGTMVPIAADLGHIGAATRTQDGRATVVFRAGTWPGVATLRVDGMVPAGETALTLAPGTPVSVQLHIHGSLSEGNGTMTGHLAQAEEQGLDVLWWTDHDFSYYPDHDFEVRGFDFEAGDLADSIPGWPSDEPIGVSFESVEDGLDGTSSEVTSEAAYGGTYGWRIGGTAPGEDVGASSWRLFVHPRLNLKSLLSKVWVGFRFRPLHDDPNAELFVTIPLSAREAAEEDLPERYRAVHLYHSSQDYTSRNDAWNTYVRLSGTSGAWSDVRVDLSDLVDAVYPTVGKDLHAELVTVTVRASDGATVAYDLDDFAWEQGAVGEDLRALQRDYLAAMATPVVQIVGQEMSFLHDWHFNAFGSGVPFFPYRDADDWTGASIADFVHANDGIVSFNHMFGVSGSVAAEEEREALVAAAIEELVGSRVYGCDLLEVGYRQRRGDIEDFLQVWDAVSMAGIFVTGEGASDIHNDVDWDVVANNFVTWVPVGVLEEDELLWNLARGNAWFGDPSRFAGGVVSASVTVPEARATMGQIVVGATQAMSAVFAAEPMGAGWIVRAVENGEVVEEWTVPYEGAFRATRTVDPAGGKVVRFEVATEGGVPVLYTNPVYFVDPTGDDLPVERLPDP